jgi:hypothetical protein
LRFSALLSCLTRCGRPQLDLTSSEPISLEGLERELAKYENHEARADLLCATLATRLLSRSLPHSAAQVVRDILRSEGAELRERASAVEGKLHQARRALTRFCRAVRRSASHAPAHAALPRQVELDSIQDYVAESDNLVALQEQIRGCDGILGKMESLLGGFQSDLGKISSEARAGWPQAAGIQGV